MTLTSAEQGAGLSGLSGFIADVIRALGEPGVGALTALETVFPPIPSEIVLPFAGYLSQRGELALGWVLVAATLGALTGAVALYGFAATVGQERASALLARIPLVDREDVDRASDWFARHGRSAVLLGRLVPGVRSLVSLPAGAQRMPLGQFVVYTAIGSLVWNSLLVGGGYALGTQWDRVQAYADWLDYLLIGALLLVVGWLALRRVRARRTRSSTRAQDGRAPSRDH
ncbi:MAG TPA: DedA family protein [Nocardioidaceae bacterium]|jgi:membrane protein DedA with SNARE-associated domain|nr:DedA family protein [Nocardioidaceae bacterium]